jgi:hypothetical protein
LHGVLSGSIIGGCLFDKFEANILLAISQFISAAGLPYHHIIQYTKPDEVQNIKMTDLQESLLCLSALML